jgi:hypothetical protein
MVKGVDSFIGFLVYLLQRLCKSCAMKAYFIVDMQLIFCKDNAKEHSYNQSKGFYIEQIAQTFAQSKAIFLQKSVPLIFVKL